MEPAAPFPFPAMKARSLPWITLTCAATALLLHRLPGIASTCEFDRTALADGELWRVVTSHFVHFNDSHLIWDLLGLLILGCWAETLSRARWALSLALAVLAIPTAVWWVQPHLVTYRGLSGLACVPFGLIVVHLIRTSYRYRDSALSVTTVLAATGFLGKTAYEAVANATLFAQTGGEFVPVPLAHLIGFAIGVAVGWRTFGWLTPSARPRGRRGGGCSRFGRQRDRLPA